MTKILDALNCWRWLASTIPDNKYAIPYLWAATGIGYNVEKVKAALGKDTGKQLGSGAETGKS